MAAEWRLEDEDSGGDVDGGGGVRWWQWCCETAAWVIMMVLAVWWWRGEWCRGWRWQRGGVVRLAFCDYHNMIAILEKSEHNVDFHQIVDFIEASNIRYASTINPTVYVSHIRQFWSTARIETTNEGTKILASVDGKPRTIFESSIRRNLKLNDEEGISSLPDAQSFLKTLH
nr:hypothetical protein [Tanacetum cinerariifolium]